MLGPPITLLNGYQVPVVFPEIRGMFGWSTAKLVQEVLGPRPEDPEKQEEYDQVEEEIENFLDRLYYELSNLGVAPPERAINYAATNLYQVASVYKEAIKKNLKLDRITTERSQICPAEFRMLGRDPDLVRSRTALRAGSRSLSPDRRRQRNNSRNNWKVAPLVSILNCVDSSDCAGNSGSARIFILLRRTLYVTSQAVTSGGAKDERRDQSETAKAVKPQMTCGCNQNTHTSGVSSGRASTTPARTC